jgi:hypothetical protein
VESLRTELLDVGLGEYTQLLVESGLTRDHLRWNGGGGVPDHMLRNAHIPSDDIQYFRLYELLRSLRLSHHFTRLKEFGIESTHDLLDMSTVSDSDFLRELHFTRDELATLRAHAPPREGEREDDGRRQRSLTPASSTNSLSDLEDGEAAAAAAAAAATGSVEVCAASLEAESPARGVRVCLAARHFWSGAGSARWDLHSPRSA